MIWFSVVELEESLPLFLIKADRMCMLELVCVCVCARACVRVRACMCVLVCMYVSVRRSNTMRKMVNEVMYFLI